MSDIVTDLRTLATMPEYDRVADMFEKCAGEIERLRAALHQIADGTDMGKLTSMQGTGYLITNVHVSARAALANAKPEQETE